MQELDKRIGLLRLLLADVAARDDQRQALSKQYRLQMQHIVAATVNGAGDLTAALAALQEVDERLGEVERGGRHLALLRARAASELEALLLTRRVAEAQAQLTVLEARQQALAEQLAALRPAQVVVVGAGTHDTDAPEAAGEEEVALRVQQSQLQQEIAGLHRLILDVSEQAMRTINPGS